VDAGPLPGDLRVAARSGVVLIPLAPMIVVNLTLGLIVNLFFRRRGRPPGTL